MDLISAFSSFQQSAVLSKVQIAVAGQLLKSQAQTGEAAVQLIQAAEQGTTQAADNVVSQATGLGSLVDVQA